MSILIKIKGQKLPDLDLAKLVKELSIKIDEYPNSATFLTINDAINSKEDILKIDSETKESSFPVQREFILQ